MAQFDLKQADIYLVDGYLGPDDGGFLVNYAVKTGFLVNNASGYTAGAVTMLINTGTGVFAVGDAFTVAGDTVEHTITAHSETMGNTTSITFTPALGAIVADDAAITHLGYGIGVTTIAIDTGTGLWVAGDRFFVAGDDETVHTVVSQTASGGNSITVTFTPGLADIVANNAALTALGHALKIKVGDGNLNYSEKRNITYVKDRGKLDTCRLGDEDPVDVKMDFTWEFLSAQSADSVPTIEEVFKKEGLAEDWVSSATDKCEPFALDVYILYQPVCASTQQPELIILPDFRYEELGHDLKQGQVSVSGKCNVLAAVRERAASFVF